MPVEDVIIEGFVQRIVARRLAAVHEMSGCSEEEIQALERKFGIRLPIFYRAFLRRCGKSAGRFMNGTDFFYRSLFNNRSAMEALLELDGLPFGLSDTEFVFSSHQGYIFHYFKTSDREDDPQIFGYMETEKAAKLIAPSFSEFLFSSVDDA